jgi:hypothetical protein
MKTLSGPLMTLAGVLLYAVNGEIGGPPEARMGAGMIGAAIMVTSLIVWSIVMLRRD